MPGLLSNDVPEEKLPDESEALEKVKEEEEAKERGRRLEIRRQSRLGLRQLRSSNSTSDIQL